MAINIKRITIATIIVLNSNNLNGIIGCQDDSFHASKKNDPKTYHYVKCNCQCSKYAASFVRGKCPKCGHYHDPGEFLGYAELKKKFGLDKPAAAQNKNIPKQEVAQNQKIDGGEIATDKPEIAQKQEQAKQINAINSQEIAINTQEITINTQKSNQENNK